MKVLTDSYWLDEGNMGEKDHRMGQDIVGKFRAAIMVKITAAGSKRGNTVAKCATK